MKLLSPDAGNNWKRYFMRYARRKIAVCLLAQLFASTLVTKAAMADAADIVVGLAVAQSGFLLTYDGDATGAVQLWISDKNARGGLLGKQIKSVASDTKSDRAQGARAGQDVIEKGASIVVVSCDYDFGSPAAAAAQRAGRLSVFLCAEDPKAGVQGAGPFAFTASIAAQVSGAAIAGWAHENLGVNSVYSLLDTVAEYNKSVCAGADWQVKRTAGFRSLGADTFKNDDASIQAQITRIASLPEKPDALILCSVIPGGASAIRQIRAAGLEMPILSTSAMDGTYWLDSVPNLGSFYIPVQASIYGDDPNPEVNAFFKRYQANLGHPATTAFAIPIYAFLNLWAAAVEAAGTTDAAKVVAVMEKYRDEPTLIGPRSFSSQWHIQTSAPMRILKYQGKAVSVVANYSVSEPVPFDVLFRTKK
jgi:branched-chain amino acid transport system substrate-binding protein